MGAWAHGPAETLLRPAGGLLLASHMQAFPYEWATANGELHEHDFCSQGQFVLILPCFLQLFWAFVHFATVHVASPAGSDISIAVLRNRVQARYGHEKLNC